MPERDKDEVRYLRSTAAKFRNMAKAHDSPLSPDLLKIAADLDRRAEEIEARIKAN